MIPPSTASGLAEDRSEISSAQAAEMFRMVVKKAAHQMDLSMGQLAAQAGIPKSTLFMLISGANDRLPSIMNCLRLARALNLEIGDFFPHVSAHQLTLDKLSGAFLHPMQIHTPELFEILQSLQPWTSAYWCPNNIPDFCKSPEFLAVENNIPLPEATAQIELYNQADYQNVPGIMLLRQSVLNDLIERRNLFARISGMAALTMMDNIRHYAQACSGHTQVIVADETTQSADPILILNKRVAITYPFGSYFVSTDKTMITFIQDRFTYYAQTLPSFSDWYHDAIG